MKKELLKECKEIMQQLNVATWYDKNLEGKPQKDTLHILCDAVNHSEITLGEALAIALITGLQWQIKFEDVP